MQIQLGHYDMNNQPYIVRRCRSYLPGVQSLEHEKGGTDDTLCHPAVVTLVAKFRAASFAATGKRIRKLPD